MKTILATLALSATLAVGAVMPHVASTDGRTWAAPASVMPHT